MLEHLELEEETLVPLVRAYMSHGDMSKLIFQMIRLMPKNEIGAIIHFTGETRIRTVSLPLQGIPDLLWPIFFQPAVDKYRSTVVAATEAIRTGIPPPEIKEETICSQFCHWLGKPFFTLLQVVTYEKPSAKKVV